MAIRSERRTGNKNLKKKRKRKRKENKENLIGKELTHTKYSTLNMLYIIGC